MTLRSLTYIVLIPAFVLTFICVWMFFSSHYRKHFEKAEHEHLRKQEMILVSYAEKHLSRLANTTKDWAVWDDTYDFMQTKSGAYTASNLAPTTLESLDIDGMLYLDSGMNLFHSYFSEETAGKARDIASAIRSSRAEIEDHSNRRLNYFFIQTPENGEIYLCTYSRIVDTNMENPPVGFFVLVLTLDRFISNTYDGTGFVKEGYGISLSDGGQEYFNSSSHIDTDVSRIDLCSPIVNTGKTITMSFKLDRSQFVFVDDMIRSTILAVMGIFIVSALIVTVTMNFFVMRRISCLTSEFTKMKESPFFESTLPESGIYELKTLAKTANSALNDIRDLNKKLLMLTNIDGLTGIPNRRFFDESFDKEFKRAARGEKEISVVMIDIDNFKKFNDTHGHINGDECLKTVASLISSSLQRPADFAARFGGEEFVVILPETGREGALHIADSIRTAVRMTAVQLTNGMHVYVTVSVGVSSAVPDNSSVKESLIEKADLALYNAKRTKDCVMHFGERLDNECQNG